MGTEGLQHAAGHDTDDSDNQPGQRVPEDRLVPGGVLCALHREDETDNRDHTADHHQADGLDPEGVGFSGISVRFGHPGKLDRNDHGGHDQSCGQLKFLRHEDGPDTACRVPEFHFATSCPVRFVPAPGESWREHPEGCPTAPADR